MQLAVLHLAFELQPDLRLAVFAEGRRARAPVNPSAVSGVAVEGVGVGESVLAGDAAEGVGLAASAARRVCLLRQAVRSTVTSRSRTGSNSPSDSRRAEERDELERVAGAVRASGR